MLIAVIGKSSNPAISRDILATLLKNSVASRAAGFWGSYEKVNAFTHIKDSKHNGVLDLLETPLWRVCESMDSSNLILSAGDPPSVSVGDCRALISKGSPPPDFWWDYIKKDFHATNVTDGILQMINRYQNVKEDVIKSALGNILLNQNNKSLLKDAEHLPDWSRVLYAMSQVYASMRLDNGLSYVMAQRKGELHDIWLHADTSGHLLLVDLRPQIGQIIVASSKSLLANLNIPKKTPIVLFPAGFIFRFVIEEDDIRLRKFELTRGPLNANAPSDFDCECPDPLDSKIPTLTDLNTSMKPICKLRNRLELRQSIYEPDIIRS